jgi:nitrite reductase/ring-hydroxylating ferredoxin subunit
MVVTRGQL